MSNVIYLDEYPFKGFNGTVYYPYFKNGYWYLISEWHPVNFLNLITLCDIPHDEAIVLKLKYGG